MIAVKHFYIQDNLMKCNHKSSNKDFISLVIMIFEQRLDQLFLKYIQQLIDNMVNEIEITAIFISAQIFLWTQPIADITCVNRVCANGDNYCERFLKPFFKFSHQSRVGKECQW